MPFVERRAFPRQPIHHLTVLRLSDETAIPALVVEVSARGARVELDRHLAEGTYLRLTLEEQIVFGHVCYCVPGKENEYAVGVQLEESLASVEDLSHLAACLDSNAPNRIVQGAEEALPETLR
ncbi:MAG: PilZ domain-containing protein [Bryobacteraceae bacterium]|nr:PilZ domain-containing protein [Bryobacteraceae bacterium]